MLLSAFARRHITPRLAEAKSFIRPTGLFRLAADQPSRRLEVKLLGGQLLCYICFQVLTVAFTSVDDVMTGHVTFGPSLPPPAPPHLTRLSVKGYAQRSTVSLCIFVSLSAE